MTPDISKPHRHPGALRGFCASLFAPLFAALVVVLGATHAPAAAAQSLSCNGFMASVGESRFSLLQKCGEPAAKDIVCVPRFQADWYLTPYRGTPPQVLLSQPCIPTEEWTFHRGAGNFLAVVRFNQAGVIESVRDGERMR